MQLTFTLAAVLLLGSVAEGAGSAPSPVYAGPTLPGPVTAPAPVAPDKPTVIEGLQAWFAKEITKDNAKLAATLQKIDPAVYPAVLAERRARAEACLAKLPDDLRVLLQAWLAESDAKAAHVALRKLVSGSAEQPKDTLDCLDAVLTKLDSRGVLLAGAVLGKTTEGKSQLKPIISSPGQVFVIRPEALTAWPGQKDSVLVVLDPREGPWTVLGAHTFESKIQTHNEPYKQQDSIEVADYLKLTRNGHFLLGDASGAVLGWIDMDKAAFFQKGWEDDAKASRDAYTLGVAGQLHGVWWNPQGICDQGKPFDKMCGTPYQGRIVLYDFQRLIAARTEPGFKKDYNWPYNTTMDLRTIRTLYRKKDTTDLSNTGFEFETEQQLGGGGFWEIKKSGWCAIYENSRLACEPWPLYVKSTLKKIYKLK